VSKSLEIWLGPNGKTDSRRREQIPDDGYLRPMQVGLEVSRASHSLRSYKLDVTSVLLLLRMLLTRHAFTFRDFIAWQLTINGRHRNAREKA